LIGIIGIISIISCAKNISEHMHEIFLIQQLLVFQFDKYFENEIPLVPQVNSYLLATKVRWVQEGNKANRGQLKSFIDKLRS